MKRRQLAINSVSTKNTPLSVSLPAYRHAGFGNVELALQQLHDYIGAGGTAADLRRLLDGLGLSCIGGFETPLMCFADDAQRADNHAHIVENCELLSELGASVLVVGTDGPLDESADDGVAPDALDVMAENFADVARRIEATGVVLWIE